jgi:outer membrane protein TolC
VKALYDMKNFDLENLKRTAVIPALQADPNQAGASDLDRFIDMAYQNRPDLQVDAVNLKAAQLAYRVALGKRLPQVDVLMEFGEIAEAFIEDLDSKRRPKHSHEFK